VLLVSIGLIAAWRPMLHLRRSVRATTLIPAAHWALAAAALWTLTWGLDHGTNLLTRSAADHLWYACSVIALCPPIAVLGSRRPGARVWTWFILIPMVFVLGWPVITLWAQGSDVRGLQLETPQLAGYLLVLIMGTGNYLGTRYTISALLYAGANAVLVLSSSAASPAWLADRWWSRLWATGAMILAVLLAGGAAARTETRTVGFDRLWLEFFDQFGLVWGRRIQDRVNFMADRENWPARLELHGLQWETAADPATSARVEHTFRWLLRRFVDPEWIDARLGTTSDKVPPIRADS
jgi:hypothetical protein